MAQNCLIPNGPPKFETVNVPPCTFDSFKGITTSISSEDWRPYIDGSQ